MTSVLSVCIILHINITNTNRKVTVVKKIVIISVVVLGVMVTLFALSARKPSDQSSLSESDVFSLYIPDKDWQIYDETLEEPAQMAAVFSSEISIWVD